MADAANGPVPVRGSAGVGVCYAALSTRPSPGRRGLSPVDRITNVLNAVRTTLIARGGTCVVLNAPAPVRDALDLWGLVPGVELMRSIKERFDPDGILAPGRFVGGI
jgi:glycolate oxidase FAD binding subunit